MNSSNLRHESTSSSLEIAAIATKEKENGLSAAITGKIGRRLENELKRQYYREENELAYLDIF